MKIWEILKETSQEMLDDARRELRKISIDGKTNSAKITAKVQEAVEFYEILQSHEGGLKRVVFISVVK